MTALDTSQFTGSENWYRHQLVRKILYTDGAKYVADTAGAYWLIDEIATGQMIPQIAAQPFQAWNLAVTGSKAVLTVEDGDGGKVFEKKIYLTDFPEPGITLWCIDNTIMVPSEY